MGTKANLNLSPIRKFISNSLLNLLPFSLFRSPVLRAYSLRPACLILVTSLSLLKRSMPMGYPFQMKRLWWNFYVALFISQDFHTQKIDYLICEFALQPLIEVKGYQWFTYKFTACVSLFRVPNELFFFRRSSPLLNSHFGEVHFKM